MNFTINLILAIVCTIEAILDIYFLSIEFNIFTAVLALLLSFAAGCNLVFWLSGKILFKERFK